MVNIKNYPKAYTEVLEILKYISKEDYKKIDTKFIDMLKKYKDKNYNYKLNSADEIESKPLLKETKMTLAYIYINYLSMEEEKVRILAKFKEDIAHIEKQKQQLYSSEIFENNKNIKSSEKELIIYKKESLLKKLIRIIKNFFQSKKNL